MDKHGITPRYDEIGLIDGKNRLYYVKNDGLYGILNQNGKVLLPIQYESIGIEREFFPLTDLKNNMILFDNCIPIKKDGKWGMADKYGNIILNLEYDELGYTEIKELTTLTQTSTPTPTPNMEKSINNVIIIPEIEGIVVGQNKKYGIVNNIGKVIIPCICDKIYSITNEGQDEVFLEKDNKTVKLTRFLEENKISIDGNDVTNTIIENTENEVEDNTLTIII